MSACSIAPPSPSSARATPVPPACALPGTLAADLAAQDLVVVSGLARGIDAAAHQGAMAGGTIAVVAGGVDVVYPPENAALMAEIAEKGLILAEQKPGVEPQARHFPRRNRVIAGLAAGTLVVEGAPKSGSLITARIAAEAGREVMAIPGSPLDPRAQGCNLLIREGATLVQSAADVVEALSAFGQGPQLGHALQGSRIGRLVRRTLRRMPGTPNVPRWQLCCRQRRLPSMNSCACRGCRRRWWRRCCSTSNWRRAGASCRGAGSGGVDSFPLRRTPYCA